MRRRYASGWRGEGRRTGERTAGCHEMKGYGFQGDGTRDEGIVTGETSS